jgi:hypothetical protein
MTPHQAAASAVPNSDGSQHFILFELRNILLLIAGQALC